MSAARDPLIAALRARRSPIRAVRYRANRSVLLSVSRDGRTLNSHVCFRDAPPEVADDVARFLTTRRGSRTARQALRRLRNWEGTRQGLEAVRRARPRRSRRKTNGPETASIRALFDRLNAEGFGGRLPAVPLRVSPRMTRSLGTIRYGPEEGMRGVGASPEPRTVSEIAIAADLLLPPNRVQLEDTMLHEMAHAEAWISHGHRGHGRAWRRIAERVGCTPRATCRTSIVRRRGAPAGR